MINGVVPFHKIAGQSSFYCVGQIRKIFHQKKVGHTGTLDLEVSGVLPICLGEATKLVNYFMSQPKSYTCKILLGIATESEDLESKIIKRKKVPEKISNQLIQDTLNTFLGENEQVPPFFSAVRYHGKKLYEYAREGIFIKKDARFFKVYKIEQINYTKYHNDKTFEFEFNVTCSKGTYIRTLCTQIGAKLGFPAVMKSLIRTQSGGFSINKTFFINDIKDNDDPINCVISIEDILKDFPTIFLTDEQVIKIRNGVSLHNSFIGRDVVLKYNNKILAIYKYEDNLYKPKTMLLGNQYENN